VLFLKPIADKKMDASDLVKAIPDTEPGTELVLHSRNKKPTDSPNTDDLNLGQQVARLSGNYAQQQKHDLIQLTSFFNPSSPHLQFCKCSLLSLSTNFGIWVLLK
jgi:hypothetical protein